ncbi:MAG: 50S ribosomal protein L21 [Candidatus Marivariicella sp.]
MYAIVEISGQQFKVAKDEKIFVHRLEEKEGSDVSFEKVLLIDDGKDIKVGSPTINGAFVDAKIINHLKGDKVVVFKKKRRKGYRVKNGHRQYLSEIQISNISSSTVKNTNKSDQSIESKAKADTKVKTKKSTVTNVKKTKDLTSMNVTDLKNMAKENGITNISKMKKADLIKALS